MRFSISVCCDLRLLIFWASMACAGAALGTAPISVAATNRLTKRLRIRAPAAGKRRFNTLPLLLPQRQWWGSRPSRRALRPARPLHSDDAETLSRRGPHHDPALHPRVHHGAKPFEACDLGRYVVGFDIDMYAAFVIDTLDLHADLVRWRFEHHVIVARSRMIPIDRAPQRLGPKLRGAINVLDITVDQNAVDARPMRHSIIPTRSSRGAWTYSRRPPG